MPLYEYYCQTCSRTFDLLRPISRMDDEALCPQCNGSSQRKLSVFASFSTNADGETSAVAGRRRWLLRRRWRRLRLLHVGVAHRRTAGVRRPRLPASPVQKSYPMSERLAIHGGTPARTRPFPAAYDYGDDDVAAVTAVLRRGNETGSISRGPEQAMFEREFADRHDARFAIFVNSGTSAFHTIFGAINPDPGDEVICTPWTSGGSVAGALFQGCVPRVRRH